MELRQLLASKSIRPEIAEVRDKILKRIVAVFLLLGIFAIIPGIVSAYSQGRWEFAILYAVFYLLFFFSFIFAGRLSYTVRSVVLILGLFLLSVSVLTRIGLSGVGLELLIVCCFICSILFNIRLGLALILVSIVSIATVGLGMIYGFIEINPSHMLTSVSELSWLTATVVFILGTLTIILTSQMLRRRLEDSLELAELQANTLQVANMQLRDEIERREQAETEQTLLQKRLHDMFDSMPSILIALDEEQRVTQWNRQAANFTGIPVEQALGKYLADLFPALYTKHPLFAEALKQKQSIEIEKLQYPFEDETCFIDCIVYPIVESGDEGAVVRIDNVTEKVLMEELLIQNEKMMSVGGLAAGMAHEINNPLGGMLQGIQNIERRLLPDMAKNQVAAENAGIDLKKLQSYLVEREVFEFVSGIKSAGRRAAKIISNMLLFSRKSESQAALVNIPDLLDNTIELARNDYDLKKNFDFKRINLIREYDPELKTLWCTETELEQVILNLLKNAGHALMDQEHNDTPSVSIRTMAESETAVIEIEDNGPGMDEETRKRLFEPFFTTKPIGKGTGLGLSVSYMIITNNHDGQLEVQSELGKGTRVTIRLPRVHAKAKRELNS